MSTKASGDHGCPAEVFLADLGLAEGTVDAYAALAIREVIAELADLQSDHIWAHYCFAEDLAGLGMWDSLDTVEFVMRLEDYLRVGIPDAVAERLPGLMEQERLNPLFCVSDMVTGIILRLKSAGLIPGEGEDPK